MPPLPVSKRAQSLSEESPGRGIHRITPVPVVIMNSAIGATAIAVGYRVATRDRRSFGKIPGLRGRQPPQEDMRIELETSPSGAAKRGT